MKKTAFLFPGQGAQYLGMEKTLCQNYAVARELFDEASDLLGLNLRQLCAEGGLDELTKTANAQPAILTTSVAAYRAMVQDSEHIPLPQFMAGHSLGEYTALTCSGSMRFADAVQIVRKRGQMMQRASALGEGAMSSISDLDPSQIEQLCRQETAAGRVVAVAGYNSANQTVISGYTGAVQHVSNQCAARGANVVALKVSAPFHSPLMQPAALELKEELVRYSYQQPSCKVFSNVTGLPYQNASEIVDSLSRQMTQPVQWHRSMQYMVDNHTGFFLELGPRKTLRNLLKAYPAVEAYSFDDSQDVDRCVQSFKKNIKSIATFVTRSMAVAVSTRNSNWNEDEYQQGMVVPYRQMKALQEQLETEARMPSKQEMANTLTLLSQILTTKKVQTRERNERLTHLFEETGTVGLLAY